jgi:hypothetical protein
LTSAPGGFDSNRTVSVRTETVPVVSVEGDELKKFKLGVDAEHAATVKPHAITAMTRLISDPTTRTRLPHENHPARVILPSPGPNANSLAAQSLNES